MKTVMFPLLTTMRGAGLLLVFLLAASVAVCGQSFDGDGGDGGDDENASFPSVAGEVEFVTDADIVGTTVVDRVTTDQAAAVEFAGDAEVSRGNEAAPDDGTKTHSETATIGSLKPEPTTVAAETVKTTRDPGPDPANPFKYYVQKQTQFLGAVVGDFEKHVAPHFVKDLQSLNASGDCVYAMLKFYNGLKKAKLYSIKMLDASGKIPTGVLYGALSSLGNFDECTSIVASEKRFNGRTRTFFRGQYCAVDIRPNLYFPKPEKYDPRTYLRNYTDEIPILKNLLGDQLNLAYFYFAQFRIGACVPDLCSVNDMNEIVKQVSSIAALNITVPWCENASSPPMSQMQVVAAVVLAAVFLLSVAGTCFDVAPGLIFAVRSFDKQKIQQPADLDWKQKVAKCFSIRANFRRLMSTDTGRSSEHVRCIHGIRVLSMWWIILGNTFLYKNLNIGSGLFEALKFAEVIPFQIVFNVFPVVDTFVTISGCLFTLNYLRGLETNRGQFTYLRHVVRRWWRLTPPFVAVSFLMMLLPLMGSGPLWHETLDSYAEPCESNWWTNLLYIGPYLKRHNMCLKHGWYLSTDMHFYLVLPLVAYLLYKKTSVGAGVLVALGLCSSVFVAALLALNDLPPIPLFSDQDPDHFDEYMDTVGYRPLAHLGPFVLGVALGFVLFRASDDSGDSRRLTGRRAFHVAAWLVAWIAQAALVVGVRDWNAYGRPVGAAGRALGVAYGALFRPAWATCIAWTVYNTACAPNQPIGRLLAHRVWVPLSRVTYFAYLVNPLVILAYTAYLREPYYITIAFTGYMFVGHVVVSYTLALLLTLVFESPFLAIDRLITNTYSDRFDPLGHHSWTPPPIEKHQYPPGAGANGGSFSSNGSRSSVGGKLTSQTKNVTMSEPTTNSSSLHLVDGSLPKSRSPGQQKRQHQWTPVSPTANGRTNMAFDNAKL